MATREEMINTVSARLVAEAFAQAKAPKTPKRSVRTTVRGSLMAYSGRDFIACLGERSDPAAQERAANWLAYNAE